MTELNLQQLEEEIITCRRCPRLVAWREEVARVKRRAYRDFEYWGKPVPGFGDPQSRVMIVGLAPGAHGSNRTGRMFTGDASGDFLFPALHQAGFASQPLAETRDDDLTLRDLFITAVCRCAPPANKPDREEMDNCLPYLWAEMKRLPRIAGIVALGKIGFDNVLRLYRQHGVEIPPLKFGHGAFYTLGEDLPWLLASYHPSRQNTQTGRLTEEMFAAIWTQVREMLDDKESQG